MRTWMLIKSNIKKNRSSSIALIILMVLATIFMNVGLTVVTKLSSFVDDKNESLLGADYVMYGDEKLREDASDVLRMIDGYQDHTMEDAVAYDEVSYYNEKREDKPLSMGILLLNMEQERKYSLIKLIDPAKEIKKNSIVLPFSLKSSYGYRVGDTLKIMMQQKEYEFEIYAFAEDVMFSTPMNINVNKCFTTNEMFQEILSEVGENNQKFYACVAVKDGYGSEQFEQAFTEKIAGGQYSSLQSLVKMNYESMKTGTTAMTGILMSILLIFGCLIIIIAIILIRFSLISFIEEDIKNIGSMEAIGFTHHMLRRTMLLQFLFIAFVGYFLGSLVSCLGTDLIAALVQSLLGLEWDQKVTIEILAITLLVICSIVILVTYRVAKRINKVTPIMALRNGVETFHFGKNYLPLETSIGSVNWIMGMKGILNNKKQNISIGIIAMITSFSIATMLCFFHNAVPHPKPFKNMIGMEERQIEVVDQKDDYLDFFEQLSRKEGIQKTLRYDIKSLTLRNGDLKKSTNIRICEDYGKTETNILGKGKYPEHDNEIALSYTVKEALKVNIGDVIQVEAGDQYYEYVVVGFLQHICFLGESASLTEKGMLRCDPSFEPRKLYLYVEDGYDTKELIQSLEPEVLARGGIITNAEESFRSTLTGFNQGIELLCVVICVITGIITAFILFYLVKMKITKERISLGILKAIGFTSGQLMLQTIISFGLVVFISSLFGILMSEIGLNRIMEIILSSLSSIKHTSMKSAPWIVGATMMYILLITVVTTLLVSLRIRKLKPRELVIE